MTPENLSRNLATLAAHGVQGSGREMIISDRIALERQARQAGTPRNDTKAPAKRAG